jgi:2C-methyl-D-erythritol 2,4-cyclodiphosphate synthase
MSRAFVKEDDGGWGDPGRRYSLPDRSDPDYDEAAAEALLGAAKAGDTGSAESATGYYWGEKKLRPFVERIRARAERDGDERLAELAERFLR